MKVFLSPRFYEQFERLREDVSDRISNALADISQMSFDEVVSRLRAEKLATHEDLYMFNLGSTRVFATRAQKDEEPVLLLLDIQEKQGSPRFLHLLDGKGLEWEIDSLIANTVHDLVNDDKVNSRMSGTNTTGWSVDTYEIESIDKRSDGTYRVKLTFQVIGEQHPERMYFGRKVTGRAVATVDSEGRVEYEVEEVDMEE